MIYVWLIQGRSPRMLLTVDVKHIVETSEENNSKKKREGHACLSYVV